jgi:hypothetical protein
MADKSASQTLLLAAAGKARAGPRGRGCGGLLGLGRAIGRAGRLARVGAPVGLRRGFADRRGK